VLFPVKKAFAVAAGIAAVVIGVAQVVHDALGYTQGAADDCAAGNQDRYLANIESTTTQLYSLDTTITGALAQLQSTLPATQQAAQAIATSVDALKATLQQALATSTDLESAIGGDTAAIGAQLDSDQAGIRASLAALDALEEKNQGNALGEIAGETSTVQSAIASSLQLSLAEIDSQAAALTDEISSVIGPAVASAGATEATIQGEYEAELRLRIEQALAADVAQVQFRLPASKGGLLDARPVGVQSVVAGDIADLERLGTTITASVRRMMKRAAADLKARRDDAAFADLQQAYRDLDDG
jgi:chromosome segregation ATPase